MMGQAFQAIANMVLIGLVMTGLMCLYDVFTKSDNEDDKDGDKR
jgi:hypothetical protein